jgi:hypothetical protein
MMTKPLSPSARRLLGVLRGLPAHQLTDVSNAELAVLIGVAIQDVYRSRTVNRGLSELASNGLITITYRRPNAAGIGSDPVGRSITVTDVSDLVDVEVS